MGIFNSVFGGDPTPVNREEMLSICEKKIAEAKYEDAARIGKKYKNRVVDSQALSDHQKYIDLAYSWYVIAKAAFKGLCSSQSYRTYEYYKGFFAAHRIGHECFQHILQNDMGEWDEGSEHFPYFEQINNYYDELYERYGVDSELDRADTDANEEISRLRSGI